jgi:hypothetical protein
MPIVIDPDSYNPDSFTLLVTPLGLTQYHCTFQFETPLATTGLFIHLLVYTKIQYYTNT